MPPQLARAPAASGLARLIGLAASLFGVLLFTAAPVATAAGAWACLSATGWWLIVRAAGFIVLSVLTLLCLKSLLPRRIPRPPALLSLIPDEPPAAYRFVARVAEDIQAPVPSRLVLGSGVELSLAGYRSLLDLVRRGRWEMQIGLWLWHFVTLSEFQALVARTLAPLSRGRTERLHFVGRYLLEALTEGDDQLDGLAGAGHLVSPVASALREIHRVATWPLRVAGSLLLRLDLDHERALADDLVAVRVTGSDALVHAVLRADFAAAAQRELDEALALAARDGLFTRDLYAHAEEAATALREAHNDFMLGEPPTLRGPTSGKYADVFEPGRRYLSGMWRGMPSGDAREQNAKKVFVAAEPDQRLATELLGDLQRLRERLTRQRYMEVLPVEPVFLALPPETVRRWLASRGGPALPARCVGCYDGGRRIDPGTQAERDAALTGEVWDDARLLSAAAGLYGQAAERATTWRKTRAALEQLLAKTLYEPTGRVRAMAEDLRDDLRKATCWLAALDRWAYVIHVHMAARLPDLGRHDELLRRYESVLRFQPLMADAREYRNRVGAFVRKLAHYQGPAPYRLGRQAAREFAASADDLTALLAEAREIRDPLLQVWTGEVPLSQFLCSREDRPERGDLTLEEFGWRLLSAWEEVTRKAKWLHRFGVAELLELHEQIEAEFAALVRSRGTGANGPPAEAIDLEPLPEVIDPDRPDPPLSPGA